MNRFFIEDSGLDVGNKIVIDDENIVSHISKSLRLKSEDQIELVTSDGQECIAEIVSVSKREVCCKVLDIVDIDRELRAKVTIFQGSPKHKKLDLIVQKCVECGVYQIVPVDMERSIKKIKKSSDSLIERLNKISLSAAEQSKRLLVPEVSRALSSTEMIEVLGDFDLVLCLDEEERSNTVVDLCEEITASKSIAVIIGPEGGISDVEREALKSVSRPITLGNRILRTETAGIAILSMLSIWI